MKLIRLFRKMAYKLEKEQKASIQAVGIDRAGAYKAVIEEELARAEIVYDKFHLIPNYNKVIDKIRQEALETWSAIERPLDLLWHPARSCLSPPR